MGAGIAISLATAGYDVVLVDANATALEAGLQRVRSTIDGSARKGRLTADAATAAIARVKGSSTYDDLATAELVIEAVFEKMSVKQDVFASIDAKTGRPTYNDDHKPGTGKYAEFCPSLWGGKDWPYEAYNPHTGLVYIPANDNHCGSLEGKVQEFVAGQWWTGVDIPDIGFTVDKNAKSYGEIQAWNVNTGKKEWTHLYPVMNWGSLLTTGRPGVQRRHQRPHVPGVRCADG